MTADTCDNFGDRPCGLGNFRRRTMHMYACVCIRYMRSDDHMHTCMCTHRGSLGLGDGVSVEARTMHLVGADEMLAGGNGCTCV